jgi:DNA-binding response OmpR family regulator
VVTAGNGLEGLSQYEKENPDLVICDVMMPEMDGYGFIKNLRIKGHTDIPFIFLTAKSDYDDLRTGMNFGADDYLVKPVKSSQLLEAINIRLQRKGEINKKVELQLASLENGFRLVADQEFYASVYDIIGYLHLLKSRYHQLDDEAMQEYLGYMERSTNRLLSLLRKIKKWRDQQNTFLQNKTEGNTAIPVKKLLLNTVSSIAAEYDRTSDLVSDIQDEAVLPLNEELLTTLLNELADNAFKFSEKGNSVIMKASLEEDHYLVLIADYGKTTRAGVLTVLKSSPEKIQPVNNDPGVGLGLSIADLIVKSVGGSLSFEDNIPSGILVRVKIPVVK